jgi:methionyl aminopeptidase
MIFGRKPKVQIKTPEQIEKMRVAGLVVGNTLKLIQQQTVAGITTLDIDAIARAELQRTGATSSFLGYHGYPAVVCTSVNNQVVHGIPGNYQLKDGDLVSVDFGAIVDGWHGDSAVTILIGNVSEEAKALSDVTYRAMWAGLKAAKVGNTLGDVGHAISSVVNAENRWGIVEDYVGHGIGTEMHMEPSVPNFGNPGHGLKLEVGMAIAIEPMITAGHHLTQVLEDDWTVTTMDGHLAAHWEHTVAITENGPWVLTELDESLARP